ncbi:MAG: hypothetical protein JWR16_2597 [Nevskia sp.]|nr:hypothetical protein [Nevskia sp.]
MRQLALLSLLLTTVAQAEVFRWTDKDGVVHYADKPLVPEARPAALPTLQTYQAGSPPPLIGAQPAAAGISISAPAAETTIRDADGKLTIEVAATPAAGQGVIYYLDGAAQNSTPTPSTALLLSRLQRGTHTLSAALVDAGGRELARAAPVTIYVKPSPAPH